MSRTIRIRWARATMLALTLTLAAACGADGGPSDDQLTGTIRIDGSSTVAPLSEAVAEEFRRPHPDVTVSVATSGTGGGFQKFCAGGIDIADASRPMEPEEEQTCRQAGIDYTRFRVGLDGIAVVTSEGNDAVRRLDYQELARIFRRGGAETWNQVASRFPKRELAIFAPDSQSGTYDFFVEEVLGEDTRPRTDYTASTDDNALVQGIAGQPGSWGFFGFAYAATNQQRLKVLEVAEDQGGPYVAPTPATIASGEYPLSRPLFIYVKNDVLERPEVRTFVRFYLEQAPRLIDAVGYVAAPAAEYQKGLAKLEAFG